MVVLRLINFELTIMALGLYSPISEQASFIKNCSAVLRRMKACRPPLCGFFEGSLIPYLGHKHQSNVRENQLGSSLLKRQRVFLHAEVSGNHTSPLVEACEKYSVRDRDPNDTTPR